MRTLLAACMALTAVWVALAAEGDDKNDPKRADPLQPNISVTPRVRPKGSADESVTDRKADIRIDTTLVLIPVSVTDPLSRFVTGLEKENFKESPKRRWIRKSLSSPVKTPPFGWLGFRYQLGSMGSEAAEIAAGASAIS